MSEVATLDALRRELAAARAALVAAEERLAILEHAPAPVPLGAGGPDAFFAMASHELRSPLHAISMYLHATLARVKTSSDGVPPEWLVPRLEKSIAQLGRLSSLVHTFLDVSRIHGGGLVIEPREADLVEVVRAVVAAMRDELAWAGCDCSFVAAEPVLGRWDTARLEVVVTNLLGNAAKYASGRPVEVRVAGRGNEVTIEVSDHGPGIDPADHARIFERFERLATGAVSHGFGLGLWIVRSVVRAHGGEVTVHSSPGEGATFVVRLPRIATV